MNLIILELCILLFLLTMLIIFIYCILEGGSIVESFLISIVCGIIFELFTFMIILVICKIIKII